MDIFRKLVVCGIAIKMRRGEQGLYNRHALKGLRSAFLLAFLLLVTVAVQGADDYSGNLYIHFWDVGADPAAQVVPFNKGVICYQYRKNDFTAGNGRSKYEADDWAKQVAANEGGAVAVYPTNNVVFNGSLRMGGSSMNCTSEPSDMNINSIEASKWYVFNLTDSGSTLHNDDTCAWSQMAYVVNEINHNQTLVTLATPVFSNTQSKVYLSSGSSIENSGSNEEIWFMWTKDNWSTRSYHEVTNITTNVTLELDAGTDVELGDTIDWVVVTSSDTDTSTVQGTTSGVLNYDAMGIERQTCKTLVLNTELNNPSFELAGSAASIATNWYDGQPDSHGGTSGDVSRENWGAHSGTWINSLHNWGGGSGTSYFWQEVSSSLTGVIWHASAWFWADGTYNATMELRVQFYNSGMTLLHGATNAFASPGETWTEKTIEANAPGGTAWVRVTCAGTGQGTEGAARVDDVELYCLDNSPATACYVTNNVGPEAATAYWTPPTGYDVMVVRRAGDWPDRPTDGNTYTNRQTYGTDNRNLVVYAPGRASSAIDYGISPSSTWYYAFFTEYDGDYSDTNGTLYAGRSKTTTPDAFEYATAGVDHFSYNASDIISVQNGGTTSFWTNPWTWNLGIAEIYSNGLNGENSLVGPTNYPPRYGNMVKMDPGIGNSSIHREFSRVTTGVLYVAFSMDVEAVGSEKYAGVDIKDGTTGKIMIGLPGDATNMAVQRSSDYNTSSSSYEIEAGETFTYICKYDFSAHTVYGYAWYTNQAIPASEPSSWLASLDLGEGYIEGISRITLSCGGWGSGDPGDVYYDEVRVATNWNELLNFMGADEATWTGGESESLFSVSGNWDPTYPNDGAQITFAAATDVNPTNDYGSDRSFSVIWFTNTASTYTLHGEDYVVNQKIENLSANTQTIEADVELDAVSEAQINPVNGDITVSSNIYLPNDVRMLVSGNGTTEEKLTVSGGILEGSGSSHSSDVVVTNRALLELAGTNWFNTLEIPDGQVTFSQSATHAPEEVELGSEGNTDTAILTLGADGADLDSWLHVRDGTGTRMLQATASGANAVLDSIHLYSAPNLVVSNVSGNTLTVNKVYEDSGDASITKQGAGTLQLHTNDTLHVVYIQNGTFRISAAGDWDDDWKYIYFTRDSGTLDLDGHDMTVGTVTGTANTEITLNGGTFNINNTYKDQDTYFGSVIDGSTGGGGVTKQSSEAFHLYGDNDYSGSTHIEGGTLYITNDCNLGAVPGGTDADNIIIENWAILYAAETLSLAANRGMQIDGANIQVDGGDTVVIGGIIADYGAATAGFTKLGTGILRLNGENTFTEGLHISAGELQLNHTAPLDSSFINLGSASVHETAQLTLMQPGMGLYLPIKAVANANDVSRTISVENSSGTATLGGRLNLETNLTITTDSGGDLLHSGNVDFNGESGAGPDSILTVTGGDTVTISGSIYADTSSSVLDVAGNVILSGANNTNNQMQIVLRNGASLSVADTNNLGAPPSGAYSDKISFSTGGGTLVATDDVTLPADWGLTVGASVTATIHVNATRTLTVQGVIAGGSGAITKTGDGTLSLNGTSTYTGATTLSAGTTIVNGDIDASSAMTVAAAAVLEGEGSVPALSISGTVKPGNGGAADVGVLAAESVTMEAAGVLALDFGDVDGSAGTDWNMLSVGGGSGSITIDATSGSQFVIELHDDNISGWDNTSAYDWTIIDGGSITSFSEDKFSVDTTDWPATGGGVFSVTQSSGDLVLHFEPSGSYPAPTECYVTNAGPESMAVMWTPPYATTDVLVVRRQGATPAAPVADTVYTNLQRFGAGDETLVIFFGTNSTSVQDMELFAETSYSYAMYACYSNGSTIRYSDPGVIKAGGSLTNTTVAFLDVGLPLDSFAYFPAQDFTTQNGGTNWTEHWVHDFGGASFSSNSLSLPGNTHPSFGNRILLNPGVKTPTEYNALVHRDFEPLDSGVFYLQFGMNMQTNSGSRYAQLILCDTNEGSVVEKMAFGVPGETNAIGIQRHWIDGGVTNWSTMNSSRIVTPGEDYMCVAKIDFTQQKAWLTGYQHMSILPSQEPSDENWGTEYEFPADWFTNLCMVRLNAGGYSNQTSGTVYFDEIRMGRYWTNLTVASSTPTNWAVWDGGAAPYHSALYSVDINWNPDARPDTEATIIFTGSESLYPTNDYGSTSQWNSIWFTNTASSFTLRGDAGYVRNKIENQSAVLQIIDQVITFNGEETGEIRPVNGDLMMNQDVYLETNITLKISGGSGNVLTFNGSILDGAGTTEASLWLVDDNTVILSNAAWYSGDTIIGGGTLRLADNNMLNDATDVIISNGASFHLADTTETISSMAGGGDVDLGSGRLTLTAATGVREVSGEISGAGGGLALTGGGTLTLSGVNSYSGSTEITNGSTLVINGDSALGAAPGGAAEDIILSGWGTLRTLFDGALNANRSMSIYNGHLDVTNGTTLNYGGSISGPGQLNKNGAGRLNLTGTGTFTNRTEIQNGTLAIGSDANLGEAPGTPHADHISFNNRDWNTLALTNSFTLDANRGMYLHYHANISVEAGCTGVYNGIISDGGGVKALAKIGAGELELGGESTFGWDLYINAGTLNLKAADPVDNNVVYIGNTTGSDDATLALGADGVSLDVPITVRNGSTGVKCIKAENTSGNVTVAVSGYVNLDDDLLVEADEGGTLLFAGDMALYYNSSAHDLTVTGANDVVCSANMIADTRDCDLNVMGHFNPKGDNRSAVNNQMKINISAGGMLTIDWVNDLGDEPTSAYTDKVNFTGAGGTLYATNDINLTAASGHQYGFTVASGANGILRVSDGRTLEIPGVISGAGDLTKQGPGILKLTSTSHTLTGSVAVESGSVFVAGATLSGADITGETNTVIYGYGTIPDLVLNGEVSPGSVAGDDTTLSVVGGITLNGGANMRLDIGDVNGTVGDDWDYLNGSGVLTIGSSSANRFRFDLYDANISGFDPYSNFTWKVVNGSSVSGYDATDFQLNTSNWTSEYIGGFSITQATDGLYLNYSIDPPPDPAGGTFTVSPYWGGINEMTFALNDDSSPNVIVRNTSGVFTTPSGEVPAVGGSLAGGTVVYYGDTSPQLDTGLDGNTTYYYKLFAVTGDQLYSGTGLTANALSYPHAPTADSATGVLPLQFTANWSAPADGATGYVFTAFDAQWEEFSGTESQTWVGDTGSFTVLTDGTTPSGGAATDGGFLASDTAAEDVTLLTESSETNFWMFSLGSGTFNPSDANNFGVVLMSDTAFSGDLNAADFAGYYLRIGNNSSPDRIRLYRSTGVGKTYLGEFADSPDFSTGALEDGLNLLVTRDSRGVFELFYSTGFEYDSVPTVSAGTLTNTDFNVADTAYFGVYQHFTTTSDGYRIYLDHVVLPTNAVCNGYAGFSTPETSTNVLGLVPNHKYGYVVKAQNASGSSTNSNVELQKTATISDPSDFTAVTNTAVPSTAIDLSWTRAGMNVMLVRSVDNIFTPPSDTVSYSQGDLIGGDEVIMASAGSDSFGDVALDGNTTYYYKLYSEYYAYYSTGVTANTTTEDNGNPVVNWSFEVAASNNKLNAYGWVYDQPDSTSTNWGDVTRESWRSQSGNYINTFHNWDDGHADPDAGFMQQVALADNDDGRIWAFSLWGSGDATWTASKVEQVVQFLDAGDSVITAFTNGISLGAAATDTFNSNVLYAAEPDAAARINLIVLAEGQGTDGAAQFDDLKLYSHRPETRNSGGGAPGAPAAVYLGDTNLVFTAETWGALTANWGTNWGQARLWIDTDSDVSDGAAGEWSGYINADARSVTSRQFTATGTWYWGIQADYGSPYGTNYWYSFDSSSWTDLAPEGTSSLSVTVNPLGAPTNVTAAAGAGDQYTEIDLTWYKWDDDGNTSEKQVLVVRSDDASFTAPTDGVAYQKDDTIDGDLVIYKGDATSCTDTGLIVDTTYYYALYSENYTYYSVASNASASTASYTPDPPSDIVVTPDGPESLHLSWTKDAGAAFSTFIVRRLGGSPTAPTDGINYTNLQEYGTDTRVVYKGAGESITDMQLLADTSDDYYYAFYTVVDSVDEYSSGSEYATNTMPFYMRGGPIDSFAYWSGGVTSQHGGTNWAGAWTHQNGFAEFTNDNLSTIPNYPPAYGGRVVMNPDSPGESVIQRSLDPVGTGVLYIAYIFRHSAAATDKYAGIALREGVQERLYIGIPGYASVLGLQYTNAAGAFITSNSLFTIHADNDYAIVAKLDFDNHNASIKGYYSDALPGYEPLWDAQITFPVDHIGAIGNLQIKCGNLEADADMGNVYYDELRISTNWQGLVESTNMPVWVGEGSPLRGFGNSTNWYPPYTPQENMSLIFADLEAAVRGEVTNDYGAYTPFRQVWFTENDYDIRIHGNAIKVQEKVENASTNSHEIQTDMSFCGIGGGISEINPTLGNLTIDGFLYIDSNVEVRVWGDNRKTLTFEHSIGEGTDGGNGKFALKGDSIVVFSATNAYAGQTTVEYGDLVITEDKCLGLQPVSTEAAQLTLNEQGTLRANISSPQALHVNRGITLGANGGQIDVVSSSLALAGPVTGSGSLTKLGAGTLVLTNTASDYTGATLVSNGILTVGSDACLGTPPGLATDGQVILYNSTFDMAAGTGSQALNRYRNFALNGTGDVFDIVTTETLNLAGAIKGAADLIKTGGGDLCITNSNNAHTGQYQIYAGRLVFGGETIGSGDVHIHDGGNFYLARVPEKTFDAAHRMYLSGTAYIECGAGNDLTENGIIGGTGSLNKQGDGGLYLMGDNTYSGGTVINGGTVFVDADESLGDTSGSVTVQNWKYLTRLSTPEVKRPKKRTIFALILP